MADPFQFTPEERGFEPVFQDNVLYSAGEMQDATGQKFERRYEVRGSGGKYYAQELEVAPDGKIIGKQTIGRARDTRKAAEEAIEKRVRNRQSRKNRGLPVGDFLTDSESANTTAIVTHKERSDRAQTVDEQQRAPVTTSAKRYAENPGRYDYPGVDTPRAEPRVKPKDLMKADPLTTEVDEESEVATGSGGFDKRRIEREFDGERVFATDVADEVPDAGIPGVAPQDFEDGFYAFANDDVMGPDPSSQRLPEGVRQNLGAGEPPEQALQAQTRGEVADIPEPSTQPEPEPGPDTVDEIRQVYERQNPNIAFSEFERRAKQKRRNQPGVYLSDSMAAAAVVDEVRQKQQRSTPFEGLDEEALDAAVTVTGFVKSQADPQEFEGNLKNLGGTAQAAIAAAKAKNDPSSIPESKAEPVRDAIMYLEDEYEGNPDEELGGYSTLRDALL